MCYIFLCQNGTVGYGGKVLAEHAGKYDLQRGWLVFSLVSMEEGGPTQELTTLAVSRVQGDPATLLARNGAKGFPSLDAPYGTGYPALNSLLADTPEQKWPYSTQIVAMVEIPDDPINLPDGEYMITAVNRRGTVSGLVPCTPSATCVENTLNFFEITGFSPVVYVKGSVLDVPWSNSDHDVLDAEQLNLGGLFGEMRAFHPKDGLVDLYPDPKATVELPGAAAGAPDTTWFHADHLTSTRMMTDATGAKVAHYDYAIFGEKTHESGAKAAANQKGFTSHEYDDELGLIYMKARYYDPVLGRFISPDSIIPEPGDSQSWNRYAYVRNNPFNNIDLPPKFRTGGHAALLFEHLGCEMAESRVQALPIAIDSIAFAQQH